MSKQKQINKLCIEYADCQRCSFGKNVFFDKEPFRVFYRGNLNANVVIVGEGPGEDEILHGRPFVGKAGKQLHKILDFAGIPRWDIFIANSFICSDDGKKKPTDEVLEACNDRLVSMIEIVEPKIVICLGFYAYRAIAGLDKPAPFGQYLTKAQIMKFVGSDKKFAVIPEYHPAYLLRAPQQKKHAAPRWKEIGKLYKKLTSE
jgi:DNA polymerase